MDRSIAKRDAESGDVQAQLYLGCEASNHMKIYWFKKAAIQGHPDAMSHLAALYNFGLATKMDLKKACEWYDKFLKVDNMVKDPKAVESALNRYGSYLCGDKAHGLSEKYTARSQALPSGLQDAKKGVALLEIAGEEFNNMEAIKMLAFGVYSSDFAKDVEKDIDKGMYWYLKGAQNGDAKSAWQLAIIFMSGTIPTHRGLRLKWLDVAAKLGWPDAVRCMEDSARWEKTLDRDVARKRLRHLEKEKKIEKYLSTDYMNSCSNPKCENVEAEGVRFNVCSKCRQTKYCCRGCQVTHWGEEHRKECAQLSEEKENIKSLNRNAAMLDARMCFNPKCHRLERDDEEFELCCDCKNALYCSRECHREHCEHGHEHDCNRVVYFQEATDKILFELNEKLKNTTPDEIAAAAAAAKEAETAADLLYFQQEAERHRCNRLR